MEVRGGVRILLVSSMAPLGRRDFRLLLAGQSISWIGNNFYQIAVMWLVLKFTGSTAAMAGVATRLPRPRYRASPRLQSRGNDRQPRRAIPRNWLGVGLALDHIPRAVSVAAQAGVSNRQSFMQLVQEVCPGRAL